MNLLQRIENKIVTISEWREIRSRNAAAKVVFTNGCFDVLHRGHAFYLARARELGDCLVVGLNSDDSVRRLKGDTRPINCEADRAMVLASLEAVSYVVIFGEDTPLELIKAVMPDVLVKGGDYTIDKIVGADVVTANGGTVLTIPFVEGYSSTKIISKFSDSPNDEKL